ncbi:phenylalanine--tRNA ligase subunit beta [Candidatus Saccharibacteria bacterium]|nr:phenylalanine--tRNA ligase subunit beta [Candidatus Saccharibacteria bacterium]MCB9821636.1 phenylalanine--tRNA ligase subunit beta [Candidatus Nomurabacteria bacterium]
MRVSYNEIKRLTGLDVSVEEMVARIGSRLGEVEAVEDWGAKYKGALIVKVITCEKHPDADKLSICTVDDGGKNPDLKRDENGYIQVVCGAPNVHADMWAVWLQPGATVPASFADDEPFVLESREIRGVISNGMLASLKELAIGDDHNGIVELPESTRLEAIKPANEVPHVEALANFRRTEKYKPGDSFAEVFDLNDYVIEIENKMFTHRPDCFGELGVAREVAGIFGKQFTSPKWYQTEFSQTITADEQLVVRIETDLVSRFSALIVEDVEVRPSSLDVQINLTKAGYRPINNIVDITNYIMHAYGQPLHAYDYAKLAARSSGTPTLVARLSQSGEQLKLLNGKTIEFNQPAIVIATDQEIVGVGGVMGGADTEVDNSTTKVVLEAANFDMYSIRRTSMHYGLFSDAASRFNKGQSPWQTLACASIAAGEVVCSSSGMSYDKWYDVKSNLATNKPVSISSEFLNSRLGSSLSATEIQQLLTNVEFVVEAEADELSVTAPFWRTDIEIKEDIVEEVGRLYGYDNLALCLPKRSTKPVEVNQLFKTKAKIRSSLATIGANELLTYSFVHRSLLEKAGQKPEDSYAISNAISPDLHFYRQSLMPSLLDSVHQNIKAGYEEFALFEVGKTHNKVHGLDESGLPGEIEVTGLVFASKLKQRSGTGYYEAKEYLRRLAHAFGAELEFRPVPPETDFPITSPYDLSRSSLISIKNGSFLGIVGEFKPGVERAFRLPGACAGFEIETQALANWQAKSPYTELSRFPSSAQDITLQTTNSVSFGDLQSTVVEVLEQTGYKYTLSTVSIFEPEAGLKNTSFRIRLSSLDKTLTTQEVTDVIESIAQVGSQKYQARQI